MISEQDIEQIRERTDVLRVVGEYVALKKKGALYWGICPFHNEKTPSFKVDENSQLFHCFGCGEGGNVFTFLMKKENMTFPEAVEHLASKIGFQIARQKGGQSSAKDKYLAAYKVTASFYGYLLNEAQTGSKCRAYLSNRGFSSKTAADFELGYAPGSGQALLKYLTKKGFKPDQLLEWGLVSKGASGQLRDGFRDRLVFPVKNLQGHIVAFGGRTLGDDKPKYINTPDTFLFHKSSLLYGLDTAKKELSDGPAVIVEGYTDVIALRNAETKGVVATMGTALTEDHLNLLNRFCTEIVLLFDGDEAGKRAANRVYDLASGGLLSDRRLLIKVALLPSGMDPCDLAMQESSASISNLIKGGVPLVEFYLQTVIDGYDIGSAHGKRQALEKAMDALSSLKLISPIPGLSLEEISYARLLSNALWLPEQAVESELLKRKPRQRRDASQATGFFSAEERTQREMIKLLLRIEATAKFLPELDPDDFTLDKYREFFIVLKDQQVGMANLIEKNVNIPNNRVSELYMEDFLVPDSESMEAYAEKIFNRLKADRLGRSIGQLKKELERLNPMKHKEKYDEMFEQLIELEAKNRDLQKLIHLEVSS